MLLRSRESNAQEPVHTLVLTKFLPLPANSGVKQRSLATLCRLAQRSRVTLVGFDDGGTDQEGLRAMGVQVVTAPWPPSPRVVVPGIIRATSASSGRWWHPDLAGAIRAIGAADPYDVLFLEFPQLAHLVRGVPVRRTVFASHNVESSLVESYAATKSRAARVAYSLEARALQRLEARLLTRSDVVAVVSERDRERLAHVDGPVLVSPNGWDPQPVLSPATAPVAAFVAHLGWAPNVDAATWLVRSIWPHVKEQLPEARLLLVGRTPTEEVRALASPDVEVTGSVPEVRPYLRRARVALAPLRAAGGSRLKILEACDSGRPVVATSAGAEGLERLVGRGVVLADDPGSFAAAVVGLLREPEEAVALGQRGHDAVESSFSWDATLAALIDASLAPLH